MDYRYFDTSDYKGNKGINGGMMKRQNPSHSITNYVKIPSIDEYISTIEQSGGKIITPRTEIPDIGYFAIFTVMENNTRSLYKAKK